MTEPTIDIAQFMLERRTALLSLDKGTIVAYMKKNDIRAPEDEDLFWTSVHMARTAARDLPMDARVFSKRWLKLRGYGSMDEGEVPEGE